MIKKWSKKWFVKNQWRFVGKLPQKGTNNILIISPYLTTKDLLFYLALTEITSIPSKLYINKQKWFYRLFLPFLRKLTIIEKPTQNIFKQNFNKKENKNILLVLDKQKFENSEIEYDYLRYSAKNRAPIILITKDNKDKLLKFHTYFYPSLDRKRDVRFVRRYFISHYKKNKLFLK